MYCCKRKERHEEVEAEEAQHTSTGSVVRKATTTDKEDEIQRNEAILYIHMNKVPFLYSFYNINLF